MREEYSRAKIRPFDLFREARRLLGPDYWLFFGITAVGMLLGNMVPFGIILGPLMCGIYLCFKAKSRGEKVEFGLLWKGFDFFGQSLIATLIVVGVTLLVLGPFIVAYFVGIIVAIENEEPALMFTAMGIFYAAVFAISLLLGALFLFVYPLIADRGVKGTTAVSLSLKASWANLGGVMKLTLLNGLLGLLGVLCCYVGVLFVMPLSLGMTWLAYRQVFPEGDTALES